MSKAQLTKQRRLKEYFRRLEKLPPFESFEDARRQLAATRNQVEDELTSIPFDPERWAEDGRMYPPKDDNIHPVEGREGVRRLNSLSHNIYIGQNGAVEIWTAKPGPARAMDKLVFSKKGGDGQGVWKPRKA